MSVKIRLRRMGAKGQPSYRVVVTDSRNPRDGRFIETIGFYNPRREPVEIRFDEAKALAWLERGAVPSDTARSLLRKGGVWARFTRGGAAPPERRQATAARKDRAGVRRKERRARAVAARRSGGGKKPAAVPARSGTRKTVKRGEGAPSVSKREA
jgi:small subunit ribosomal protein S16